MSNGSCRQQNNSRTLSFVGGTSLPLDSGRKRLNGAAILLTKSSVRDSIRGFWELPRSMPWARSIKGILFYQVYLAGR